MLENLATEECQSCYHTTDVDPPDQRLAGVGKFEPVEYRLEIAK